MNQTTDPSITPYLLSHLRAHPAMTPRDIAKLCYQAAHGAEHLLADVERARGYLVREMETTEPDGTLPLIEPISDAVARVHLAPWKARGLSADTLFELFVATARVSGKGGERLSAYLAEAGDCLAEFPCTITPDEWREFLAWYDQNDRPAVHHSEAYRLAERPAYRIVLRSLLREAGLE